LNAERVTLVEDGSVNPVELLPGFSNASFPDLPLQPMDGASPLFGKSAMKPL
jgi:hypothetical protein